MTGEKQDKPQRPPLTFRDVFRFVFGYWRRQPRLLSLYLVFYGMAAVVETNLPNMLAAFLGAVRQHEEAAKIILCLALFIGNYFVQVGLRWAAFLFYNKFETLLFKNLMEDAFAHVHRLSDQFFANNFTGSIISKITRARGRIEPFEDHILHRVFTITIILIGSIAFLSMRLPVLALLLLIYLVVLLTISITMVIRISGPSQSAYAAQQDKTVAQLADAISGISTTKAFVQEDREVAAFSETLEALRIKNHKAYFYGNFIGTMQNIMLGGMMALLLGGGTWYFLQGKANVEDIAYLTLAYTILQSYLRELAYNIKDIVTASYDLHAAIHLMREKPHIMDKADAQPLNVQGGAIAFDNVTFTYPGKKQPVFQNFSITIRAGERVALVGHSGSGKTTFLRLLQRSYDIEDGRIMVDGQDVAAHTMESLRANIAVVPQDPILFHRTLKSNIAYGRPEASMDDIRDASRKAYIDAFIQTLPQGYDTMVGERGVKLSGGERQRVALARALLADRPILVLDEATSSLDSASEKAIQDALHTLIQGRTSIMVAHRLSTILDADRILVFDNGKIVEEGTHAHLLERNGLYASLFKLQSGGFIGE